MKSPEFPQLHPHRVAADGVDAPEPSPSAGPGGFITTLTRIGMGAAADGYPWPEPHPLPGRRIALADADCALAGLRVGLEMLLAAERVRQNGPDEEYVGDRVMEGLMMACLAMTAQVSACLQPEA